MIVIGDTLVSEDLFDQQFICNLSACKGACCIEGDSGAPVNEQERELILSQLDKIKPYMSEKSLADITQKSCFEKDEDDEWVTTCLPTGECNFVTYAADGCLSCAIERSYLDGNINIRKPSSCYLYPIRLVKVGNYTALNYHRWDICKAACELGKKEKVAVYQFLKDPLISVFGAEWYAELEEVAVAYLKETNAQ